jgi:hypothetical protein
MSVNYRYLFVLIMFVSGCSSTMTVKPGYSVDKLNDEFRWKPARLFLKDGTEHEADSLRFYSDSLCWYFSSAESVKYCHTNEVRKIVQKDQARGAMDGLVCGCFGGFTYFISRWFWPLSLASPPIGLITGTLIGHTKTYSFADTTQSKE